VRPDKNSKLILSAELTSPLQEQSSDHRKIHAFTHSQSQKPQSLNASTKTSKPLKAKSRIHDCIPSKRPTEAKRLCPLSEAAFLSCSLQLPSSKLDLHRELQSLKRIDKVDPRRNASQLL